MIVDGLQQASLIFGSHSPKQGVAMATISQSITRIMGEHELQGITIKRRNSKNGYTTPYEIYCPHEVIKTLSDPGHWEKKCG